MPPASPTAAADVLARWLPAACVGLGQRREELNSINVFPIADADTGDNVHLTLQAGAAAVVNGPKAASRAMLFGAYGNSGSIVASFFSGWTAAVSDSQMTTQHLAAAITAGQKQARQAVSDPIPGTILSVLEAIQDAAAATAPTADLSATYLATYAAAQAAVAHTTSQLQVLAEAAVVDAGAAAWLVIWHSLGDALGIPMEPEPTWGTGHHLRSPHGQGADGQVLPRPPASTSPPASEVVGAHPVGFHGSGVTELLVTFTGDAVAAQAARDAADTAGDSVVLVSDGDVHRLHVHTTDAEQLVTQLRTLVTVQDSRAETIMERDCPGGDLSGPANSAR